MIKFALQLDAILRSAGMSRQELQSITNVGLPTISKYMNGKLLPKASFLSKVMTHVSDEQATAIFIAYLEEVFSDYDDLDPLIAPITKGPHKKSGAKKSQEVKELEHTVETLKELALQKPEVAKLLQTLLVSLTPQSA